MNLEQLKRMIAQNKYKVISFDLFDTLLVRPCMQPTDILKLVGRRCGFSGNFLEMRRASEKNARKECEYEEIQYTDIYQQMTNMFEIADDMISHFQEEELNVEKQYLYARTSMKDIYQYAIDAGKKVIITSDIYLPLDFIKEVLEKNGFTDYTKIFLSSEYRVMKSTGKLFDIVIEELKAWNIDKSEILHMGDNEKSDVTVPLSKGIKSVFIPRTMWLLRKNRKLRVLYENIERMTDNSFLVGFSANTTFNDPFRPYNVNTYFYGSRFSASNMLFAPMFFVFTKWLLENCITDEVDTLCLVYRDGYIPEQIFDIIKPFYINVPEIRRLYMTRAMINSFYGDMENGLVESLSDMLFSDLMTVDEFIRNRLFVEDEDEYNKVLSLFIKHGFKCADDKVGRRDDLLAWIKELYPFFEQNAKKRMLNIKDYCRASLRDAGKIAVYDVGYRGRVSVFLKEKLNIESICYHLFAKEDIRNTERKGIKAKFVAMYGLHSERNSILLNCLTEDLLNAPEASVYSVEKTVDNSFRMLREKFPGGIGGFVLMQDYIVEYAKKFTNLFGNDLSQLQFDFTTYFEFYREFLTNPSANDTKIVRNSSLTDSTFMNPNARNVYKKWEMENRFSSKVKRILYEMENSIWKISGALEYRKKPVLVVCGTPKYITKSSLEMIDRSWKNQSISDVSVIVETTDHEVGEYSQLVDFRVDIMNKIDMPRGYDKNVSMPDTAVDKSLLKEKTYLKPIINELAKRHIDMGKNYPETIVCYWYKYYNKIIDFQSVGGGIGFLVYDKNSIMHRILKEVCRDRGVSFREMREPQETTIVNSLKTFRIRKPKREKKKMRIAICASMPRKGYSGGRTHALNLAECLSYMGNKVYFISKYLPAFVDEMKEQPGHSEICFVSDEMLTTDKSFSDIFEDKMLDYLIIVPHEDSNEVYYKTSRNLAKKLNAKIVLLNYETPNWMNQYLDEKQDETKWKQWKEVCEDGSLVLCSDKESVKYARMYYDNNPENTRFDYWYPTINSIVADKVHVKKENNIVAFVRPGDKNKGTEDVLNLIDENLKGFKIVLICGRGIRDKHYFNLMDALDYRRRHYGLDIELKVQVTDYEKFLEIARAKVMLFPSKFEGYGTPPIEAQYFNTQCIAYDLPVLRETCGSNLIYCRHGDVEDMRKKLLTYIKNKKDVPISYHDDIYDIANFERCAVRLHNMFESHFFDDWRVWHPYRRGEV